MHPARTWLLEQLGQKAAAALQANGFDAVCVANADEARAAVLARIPAGASIGFGGSMTLGEIGLIPALEAGGYDLINPPNKSSPTTRKPAMPSGAVRSRPTYASPAPMP